MVPRLRILLIAALLSGLLLALLGLRSASATSGSAAVVRYVAPTGTDAGNDCTRPASPCRTIQHAVDQAGSGDEIRVAAGRYDDLHRRPAPTGYPGVAPGGEVTQIVYLTRTLVLRGGFAPPDWTTPDPQNHPTILDARKKGRGILIAGPIAPVVEGFQVTAGRAISYGGGILVLSATVTLRQNRLQHNQAGAFGGGLFLQGVRKGRIEGNHLYSNTARFGGGVAVHNSLTTTLLFNRIEENLAYEGGGGAFLGTASSVTFTANVVEGNRTKGAGGGGVEALALASDIRFQGNRIAQNRTQGTGGGVHATALLGAVRFSGDRIYANEAITGGGLAGNAVFGVLEVVEGEFARNRAHEDGGGVYLSGGFSKFWITRTRIYENRAGRNGGGVRLQTSLAGPQLAQTYVYRNEAQGKGGGLYADADLWTGIDLVVADNRAASGSGLALAKAKKVRLIHPTVARNGGGDGSGLHLSLTSTVEITNAILVSHTVALSVAAGSRVSLNGTLWGDGSPWANGARWTGPGSVTHTRDVTGHPRFVQPDLGDYHLTAASAAVDAGAAVSLTYDVDGQTRPQGTAPDLGADEFPAACASPTGLQVDGPRSRTVGLFASLTATVVPTTATPAFTFLWEADGQASEAHPNRLTPVDGQRYAWTAPGVRGITVTLFTPCGTVTATHVLTVTGQRLYLPVVLRAP